MKNMRSVTPTPPKLAYPHTKRKTPEDKQLTLLNALSSTYIISEDSDYLHVARVVKRDRIPFKKRFLLKVRFIILAKTSEYFDKYHNNTHLVYTVQRKSLGT